MTRRFALALLALAAFRAFAWVLMPLAAEDAYITFHAAIDPAWRHAATSPAWALLVSPAPFEYSRVLSLVADVAAVWAACRVLTAPGVVAFLAVWLGPYFAGSAMSGLETHIAACALVLAEAHPAGYAIAAALRPDTALLALCSAGRRWAWAISGAAVLAIVGVLWAGSALPGTVVSKLAVYGIHPGAWQWLHPWGFGWMTVALVPALCSRRLAPWAALACLAAHVALGTPGFWWYAVPPLAVLTLHACRRVTRPRHALLALAIVGAFLYPQTLVLRDRTRQEGALWAMGARLAALNPTGTILLEPAGMIPYQSPQLTVADEVGLTDPWIAARRSSGRPGWRTDAIRHYRPDWLVVRMREYLFPATWTIGSEAYRDTSEARIPGYGIVFVPPMQASADPHVRLAKMESSSLIVLHSR